jgi:hypothetical protein
MEIFYNALSVVMPMAIQGWLSGAGLVKEWALELG